MTTHHFKQHRLSPTKTLIISAALALPFSTAVASDEVLYLTIRVNGVPVGGLFQIHKQGQQFFLGKDDFNKLNLNSDGLTLSSQQVGLASHPGLDVHYDDLQQQLDIQADIKWLGGNQQLKSSDNGLISNAEYSAPVRGAALNYSFYGSEQRAGQSLSAYTQLRSFGLGPGNFTSSFNSRFEHMATADISSSQRLMTSWTYNNPDKLLSLTLGDSYTDAQTWTQSVRIGGFSLSHNYALQPNFNTSARDILSDTVALPSTVDLYVQGIRQSTRQVDPGQFTLNTSPVFTGNSNARVVITDINGQQRVINLNLYGSDQLLTPGIGAWSINGGWLREDYALRSFSYRPEFMTSANGRYGLSNTLTAEGHTELGQPLQNGGVGANYLLSPWLGMLHTDYSVSRYSGQQGTQRGVGWQWSNQQLTISATRNQRSLHYADMSVLADGQLATRSDNAFVSWSLKTFGTFGVSWIQRQYRDINTDYAGLSWSRAFAHHLSVSASLTRAMDQEHGTTLYLNLSLPLNDDNYLSLQHSRANNTNSQQVSWTKTLVGNKPGWGADVSIMQGAEDNSHLDYRYRSSWSDSEFGYNRSDKQNNYYATLSGAIGWFNNGLYATRELGDAFAIVDTGGVPHIPVFLSHQPAGTTDSHGRLFLNNLLPNYRNPVTIDVLSLPLDYRALYTEQQAIPASGGGASVNFSVYRTRALLLTAKGRNGTALTFASSVSVTTSSGQAPEVGTSSTVVGYGGNIYLESPPAGGDVLVHQPNGDCHIRLPEQLVGKQAIVQMEAVCQ